MKLKITNNRKLENKKNIPYLRAIETHCCIEKKKSKWTCENNKVKHSMSIT